MALVDKVAAQIKKMREQRGLTQEDLAAKASVSRGYLARVETARHEPTLTMLGKLAKALRDEMADRPNVGVVEVTRREMPEEIADRSDPEPFEELRRLAADAGQRLDLEVEARRVIPQRR